MPDIDGESIADVEARLGRTVGPVMLKLELTSNYGGSGKVVRVTATHTVDGSKVLTATIPAGARSGDWIPLDWAPHHDHPLGYYTDVTAFEEVSGDGFLACKVVNDGPAWHSSVGVAVQNAASSPWACDVQFGSRDPDLAVDETGRLHVAYIRDGSVMHVIENADGRREAIVNVSQSAGSFQAHHDPSVQPQTTGRIVVSGDDGTASTTRVFASEDDGQTWTLVG